MDRPIVPAGVRVMTIIAAEEGPNQYKISDDNPEGTCLKLRLADSNGGYRFVFDDLPQQLAWRAVQLAESLGIKPVNGALVLTPGELMNRELAVELSHYTSKAGKISAVVKRYLPPDAGLLSSDAIAAATPKATRQTTAQRITAALPDDEIPF
jgi:hypothetical protein